jgi:chromosome segregation ATPase
MSKIRGRIVAPQTYEQELLNAARAVARLQSQRRSLRRKLRQLEVELRHERKILRAIASRNDERRPDVMPSRVFGDGVGLVPKTGTE